MNQYKSGTDEEEPQTLVIEPMQPPISPSKMPISQAEFDDMPLPAASSRLKAISFHYYLAKLYDTKNLHTPALPESSNYTNFWCHLALPSKY